jgi:hypothetical protein
MLNASFRMQSTLPSTNFYRAVTAVHAAKNMTHVYPTAYAFPHRWITHIEEPTQILPGKQATAPLRFVSVKLHLPNIFSDAPCRNT